MYKKFNTAKFDACFDMLLDGADEIITSINFTNCEQVAELYHEGTVLHIMQ
jgi:hypothetical protein